MIEGNGSNGASIWTAAWHYLTALALPFLAGSTGHLMRFFDHAMAGNPLCWRRLLMEGPAVFGFSIMSAGAAEYFGFGYLAASGLAALAGWIGPKTLMNLILPRLAHWQPGGKDKTKEKDHGK